MASFETSHKPDPAIGSAASPASDPGLARPAIVIPAYNEEGSVGEVIAEIREACNFPVYLVDDASDDNTVGTARRAGARVIPLATRLGAWGATQTGIRFAAERGHDCVITMDADGQHDPRHVHQLLAALRDCPADTCIGSWPQRGSASRKLAWRLLRATSGIRLEDLTSGYRAYNLRAIEVLTDWRATFLDYQDVGVLSLLRQQGITVVDVRTEMRLRQNGYSRVFHSWLIVFYYMCHTLLLGLSKRRIRSYRAPTSGAVAKS